MSRATVYTSSVFLGEFRIGHREVGGRGWGVRRSYQDVHVVLVSETIAAQALSGYVAAAAGWAARAMATGPEVSVNRRE